MTRTRYYFAWFAAEGAAVAAGFGYRPPREALEKGGAAAAAEPDLGAWDGVSNIDALGFEVAPSFSSATRCWNVSTSIQSLLRSLELAKTPHGSTPFRCMLRVSPPNSCARPLSCRRASPPHHSGTHAALA